jgi:hypothetical protein
LRPRTMREIAVKLSPSAPRIRSGDARQPRGDGGNEERHNCGRTLRPRKMSTLAITRRVLHRRKLVRIDRPLSAKRSLFD